jgi:hypothetical protein
VRHQHGLGFDVLGCRQELPDFVAAEDDGERFAQPLATHAVEVPRAAEGNTEEEVQGTASLVVGAERDVAFVDKVEQEGAGALDPELVGGLVEVLGELGDGSEVSSLRVLGHVAHAHVVEHALP